MVTTTSYFVSMLICGVNYEGLATVNRFHDALLIIVT